MVDGDVEIVPPGSGKTGAHLVIQPDSAVPFERELHRGPQDIVAFFIGDPPSGDDAHDIVGQFPDEFDHRNRPLRCDSVESTRPARAGRIRT
jgi:hypothetical protein